MVREMKIFVGNGGKRSEMENSRRVAPRSGYLKINVDVLVTAGIGIVHEFDMFMLKLTQKS